MVKNTIIESDCISHLIGRFRRYQHKIAIKIIDSIKKGEDLLIVAPSGIGKTTVLALSSVMAKHSLDANLLKTLIVVRTWRQVDRIVEELLRVASHCSITYTPIIPLERGCMSLRQYVTSFELIRAYCLQQRIRKSCPFYLGTQNGVKLFNSRPEDIIAGYHKLAQCPHYSSILAASLADIVIGTYNIIFSPISAGLETVLAKITYASHDVTGQRNDAKNVLMIDEAHNIPNQLFSSRIVQLTRNEIINAIKILEYYRVLDLAEKILETEKEIFAKDPNANRVFNIISEASEINDNKVALFLPLESAAIVLSVIDKLKTIKNMLLNKECYTVKIKANSLILGAPKSLVCPSVINNILGFKSIVMTSATMHSSTMIILRTILRQRNKKLAILDISSTDPLNRRSILYLDTAITSRFKERDHSLYLSYANYIVNIFRALKGPIAFYTTSYEMLNKVYDFLLEKLPLDIIYVETRNLTDKKARLIVDNLIRSKGVLLAIYGGRFDEGEDFLGGRLTAVILGGLPIPPPTNVNKEYFIACTRSLNAGENKHVKRICYELVYLQPAITRLIQAAGRVFRKPNQLGYVFVLDNRVTDTKICSSLKCLPKWLRKNVIFVATNRSIGNDYMSIEATLPLRDRA